MKRVIFAALCAMLINGCGFNNCDYTNTPAITNSTTVKVGDVVKFDDIKQLELFYPNVYYYNNGLYHIVNKDDNSTQYFKVTKVTTIEDNFNEVYLEEVHKHDAAGNCLKGGE